MKSSANRLLLVLGLLTALLGGLTAGSATAAEGPRHRIVNYQTSGNLTPYYYGTSDRDGIQIWTGRARYTGEGNQWTFESVGNGSRIIRNAKTDKCLRPVRFGSETRVEQWTCSYTPEFQWRLRGVGLETYKITSVSTGGVLTPFANRELTRVVLEEDQNTAKQRWSVTPLF
ncbi:hypothetical protein GCM10012287_31530 [Streptomyces daqingensis]|uniref:Ricin B lectin domain-containing protein n=1 Tax=Streptomyces daqingensis TaxID=1472640 RepID=A0ABQ2ME42_9ACTN|nr:RICIN domain-containing protein [Streptomyces daqingensis]GGO50842.1 hypothetical protein GCM10012287_31530 [Streptomyces daqingensis]